MDSEFAFMAVFIAISVGVMFDILFGLIVFEFSKMKYQKKYDIPGTNRNEYEQTAAELISMWVNRQYNWFCRIFIGISIAPLAFIVLPVISFLHVDVMKWGIASFILLIVIAPIVAAKIARKLVVVPKLTADVVKIAMDKKGLKNEEGYRIAINDIPFKGKATKREVYEAQRKSSGEDNDPIKNL